MRPDIRNDNTHSPQNKRTTGSYYEKRACDYLRAQGYRILEKNYRCRAGEIDLIAREDGYLVFVEVKYRSSGRAGDPAEAVDRRKQKRICRAASFYLMCAGMHQDDPVRFDIVSILNDEIRLIRNAFPYCL